MGSIRAQHDEYSLRFAAALNQVQFFLNFFLALIIYLFSFLGQNFSEFFLIFETFANSLSTNQNLFAAGKFEDDEGDGTDSELSSKRGHVLGYSRRFPASQRMDRAGLGTISLEIFKTHDRVIPF
jgi:hypothetical protein